jgi:FHA domain-containing protein/von Willebrand factor type A domain-containing protein
MTITFRVLHRKEMRRISCLALWALAAAGPKAAAEAPVLVAFALDTSGSVGRDNLARAQVLALGVLERLPEGSEVAVFSFDDRSRLVVPRTSSPEEIRQRIRGLRVSGRFTALHDGLYDASRYLREAPSARRAIVLITDGRDENSALDLEDGLRLVLETGIPVFTVGVGTVQERVLRRIAKLTGGEYLLLSRVEATSLARLIASVPARATAPGPAPADASKKERPAQPAAAAPGSPKTADRAARRGALVWGALGLLVVAAGILMIRSRRAAPLRSEEELSPTVIARMNVTEEYLEKTVTLREKPVLSVTRGPATGETYDLRKDGATSIGRAKANDIVIGDVSVSSEHCRIRPENGHFVVHDLKSTNGTFVNERKVATHSLAEGDVIRLGETSLQYRRETSRS